VDGCVECPYHGWRYSEKGDCTAVPSLGPDARIPSSVHVQSFQCTEQDGYVWIFCGATEPAAQPFAFPHINDTGWTTFRMKTRFSASVEACLENFLDCPHTVFVHKGWFRNPDARTLTALVRKLADSVEVEFRNEPTSDSVIARLFYPRGQPLRHVDRFIMPNLSRVDYDFGPQHHFIITSQCTPVSDTETEVYTVMTYRYGAWAGLIRLFFEPMSRHIIKQDVDILAAQTKQLQLFGGGRFAHVETDLLGLHIQAMRRHADGASKTPLSDSDPDSAPETLSEASETIAGNGVRSDPSHVISEREITIRF
jgi:phenylpropionate dioxygenase-like ring-hydroxylating dioxygenase large terminal subunit